MRSRSRGLGRGERCAALQGVSGPRGSRCDNWLSAPAGRGRVRHTGRRLGFPPAHELTASCCTRIMHSCRRIQANWSRNGAAEGRTSGRAVAGRPASQRPRIKQRRCVGALGNAAAPSDPPDCALRGSLELWGWRGAACAACTPAPTGRAASLGCRLQPRPARPRPPSHGAERPAGFAVLCAGPLRPRPHCRRGGSQGAARPVGCTDPTPLPAAPQGNAPSVQPATGATRGDRQRAAVEHSHRVSGLAQAGSARGD